MTPVPPARRREEQAVTVQHADCLAGMMTLDAESIDAIVTDPPYGLAFMGKAWDHGVPGVPFWTEALRVAKPGAHLLAFGGTRTYHRLACAIEDAGWEIRDCLSWLYGSGFPKSHNGPWGGTALKPAHEPIILARKPLSVNDEMAILAPTTKGELWLAVSSVMTDTHLSESASASGFLSIAGLLSESLDGLSASASKFTTATAFALITDLRILRSSLSRNTHACTTGESSATNGAASDVWLAASISRSVLAKYERLGCTTAGESAIALLAELEEGQEGAGLRPNWEPIILARKPLIGTVAANVAQHGTGGLNIKGCRIPGAKPDTTRGASGTWLMAGAKGAQGRILDDGLGRWPANVALDPEAAAMLDEQSGERGASGQASGPTLREPTLTGRAFGSRVGTDKEAPFYADTGGASRFFYCAKASRAEREAGLEGRDRKAKLWSSGEQSPGTFQAEGTDRTSTNHHPTVKPVSLMRWLCRLVTPPGGLILDPFTGSGTTGCAAALEGFRFLGFEQEAEYVAIAERRIAHWRELEQPGLFGGVA